MGDGGHWRRGNEELLRALVVSEERARREYATSLELIAELATRDAAAELGYSGLADLLRDVMRIGPTEARRRIGHAEAVAEVPLVSGGVVPAALPVAAAALRDGVLGADHLEVIAKVARELPPHVPTAAREAAEQALVDEAHRFDARTLARIGDRLRAVLDQDGTPPDDRELAEPVNELHLHARRDGRLVIRGEFAPEASALITAVVSPLAKPRPSGETGPDQRSVAERQGDALVEVFHLVADEGALPSEGGEKPHVLVTVPLDVLRDRIGPTRPTAPPDHADWLGSLGPPAGAELPDHAGPLGPLGPLGSLGPDGPDGPLGRLAGARPSDHAGSLGWPAFAELSDHTGSLEDSRDVDRSAMLLACCRCEAGAGPFDAARARRRGQAVLDGVGPLDAESARRIACDARIIPVVLGSRSEPLDLGRASYTVSTALRRALILRDGGCAFPGCDRTHRWCHSHHIRHWADDGPTELGNLVLLCGRHHRLVHHSDWTCTIAHGRAEFRPPHFMDPTRTPRHNPLHHSAAL